ncbi:hypothetical protein EVAR_69286_1, partial [Eumeta japonica]
MRFNVTSSDEGVKALAIDIAAMSCSE